MKYDKILVLDMDGTFIDFYGVEGWQKYLDEDLDETPYRIAQPIYDMSIFVNTLNKLRDCGWAIVICSWLSKTKTEDFHNRIRKAKTEWLEQYKVPCDYILFMDYDEDKHAPFENHKGIHVLVDDNADIRNAWHGPTIDASKNILPELNALIEYDYI